MFNRIPYSFTYEKSRTIFKPKFSPDLPDLYITTPAFTLYKPNLPKKRNPLPRNKQIHDGQPSINKSFPILHRFAINHISPYLRNMGLSTWMHACKKKSVPTKPTLSLSLHFIANF